MELLLGRSGPQIPITEDVVKAVAGNSFRGKKIPITMEVIKKLAENDREDRKSKKATWNSRKQCATTPQVAYPTNKNARVKGSYKWGVG
ncbi:hypothetical protein V8C37DRAFT_413319 [Trichoderma ceciliae]